MGGFHGDSLTSFNGFIKVTSHVESLVIVFVSFSVKKSSESGDGFFDGDEFSWFSRENFTHEEWLGKESLDLSGSFDSDLVFSGQFVHTQNSDNILEGFVILKQFLDISGNVVVLVSDNEWGKHLGGGVEWIDSWVDTESKGGLGGGLLCEGSGQHSGGVEMRESGGWGWIGEIISWHVDGLDGGNGPLLGGGDSFLEGTEIGGEGWLVTDSGWNTSQKG